VSALIAPSPTASRINEDDRLDGDTAEDVPDRDAEVVRERRARRDRDLRQVRCNREEDEPSDRLSDAEPVVEHVGRVRKLDACNPDGAGCTGEDEHQKGQRHAAVAFVA
jgi:hypothetical protein